MKVVHVQTGKRGEVELIQSYIPLRVFLDIRVISYWSFSIRPLVYILPAISARRALAADALPVQVYASWPFSLPCD